MIIIIINQSQTSLLDLSRLDCDWIKMTIGQTSDLAVVGGKERGLKKSWKLRVRTA